jgi:hypothetical protein
LDFFPQISENQNFINNITDIWHEVTDTLNANGDEKYLTIGNFYDDQSTKYLTLDISDIRKSLQEKIKENKIAYYYIDMVSVTLINDKFNTNNTINSN